MSLLDHFLRALGTNRTRMAWRWRRFKDDLSRQKRAAANRGQALTYEHQTCPSCGHPASRDEEICTRCGQRLRGVRAQRAERVLSSFIPDGLPIVTIIYLGICATLFLLSLKVTGELADPLADPGDSGPSTLALVRLGGNHPFWTIHQEQWWRLITANLLHGGVMHLVLNAYGLWISGRVVEDLFGRSRALFAFVLTGIAGAAASVYMSSRGAPPWPVSIGASTAGFGLMGLVIAVTWRRRRASWAASLRQSFVPWLLYGLVMTFAIPQIDVWGHLGGLAGGAVLGLAMRPKDEVRRVPPAVWTALALGCVAAIVWALIAAGRYQLPRELVS